MNQQAGYYDQTWPGFQRRLVESVPGVERVVKWIDWRAIPGVEVRIKPLRVAPTPEEAAAYSDDGDLEIRLPGGEWECAEVKHIGYNFTDKRWPFDDFLICRKSSFDRMERKPIAYWILSKDGNYVAELNVARTFKYWGWRLAPDINHPGKMQVSYCCLPQCVTLYRIDHIDE